MCQKPAVMPTNPAPWATTNSTGSSSRTELLLFDGFLVNVGVGSRVLDQVVAERRDIGADELQNSLAGGSPFLEELDQPIGRWNPEGLRIKLNVVLGHLDPVAGKIGGVAGSCRPNDDGLHR